MRPFVMTAVTSVALFASAAASHGASGAGGESNDFVLQDSGKAKEAHGSKPSKLQPTRTEAAMRFIVVDKDKGPIEGVVIVLAAAGGEKYYTDETDGEGYAEVLVPVGKKYEVTYLSLGRKDIATSVTVANEPKQNVKLTLRYHREGAPPPLVLTGVNFDTGKATIRPESFPQLDHVVAFMARRKSARVEISGHTDNVGKAKANKILSEKRAKACRAYIVSKGIEASRLDAVGYGDERPLAPNDTDEGRQKNRRMEARELGGVPN
ncbi:MAG: OmpA family protein [Myxococcales bacterium]